MKKRLTAILLCLCLILTLMPAAAFAADTGKAIQAGTGSICGWDSAAGYDYIYYGYWTAPDVYTASGPIKWRVLDDQTNTQSEGLFLLSEALLGTGYQGGVYFDNTGNNVWQGSNAQAWCKDFAGIEGNSVTDAFSAAELAAILETTKSDPAFTSGSLYGTSFKASENILNGDKVFFLSAEEVETSAYGFTNDEARVSDGDWLLRSPSASYAWWSGLVYVFGAVCDDSVSYLRYARPAFNLDSNSVLFTSAAEGGKSQNGMDDGLTAVSDYAGNEWKLTLLDEKRSNFNIATTSVNGNTLTAAYSDAVTGDNEYISAAVMDENGDIAYYGRLQSVSSESGTVQVTLPEDFNSKTDTLYIFNEQYNGDKTTDYASELKEVSMIPVETSIQAGTESISGWDSAAGYDYIYYGIWNNNPVKWRVLDDQTNTGTSGLFLLSEDLLGETGFDNDKASSAWQDSDAKVWCGNFYSSSFSSAEQAAVLATTKSDDAHTSSSNSTEHFVNSENILNGDKVFFLSAEEVENSAYGFTDNDARRSWTHWWLRSPSAAAGSWNGAGSVLSYGYVVANNLNAQLWTRPAFNLDPSAVLFTSAAENGKSQNGMDGALTAVSDYAVSEWKLTLLDSSRNGFTAATGSETSVDDDYSDWTVEVDYSGARTGGNEYVSAMLVDGSGGILYYGRIAQNSADGTAGIAIPSGLAAGSYTLKVFSEQYNGAYKTDYASAFVDIALTVKEPDVTPPALKAGTAVREKGTEATVTFTSDEAGSYYYTVVESGAAEGTEVNTDGSGAACTAGENAITLSGLSGAGAKDIYIAVKDAAGNVSGKLKMTVPGCYAVTVETDGEGSASANPSIAVQGEEVVLTASPGEGNHFVEWRVASGTITVTENKFTMPGGNVTVTAVFEACRYDRQVVSDAYLASAASCTDPAEYYYSCACGAAGTETFTDGTAAGHGWGSWQSNGDGTHTRVCQNCADEETESCAGGAATCVNKAICSVCGAEYGAADPGSHTGTIVWIQTQNTHKQEYSCCHAEVSAEENHDWQNGKCTVCQYPCAHEGGTATCMSKAVCENCGSEYGNIDPDNHNPAGEWTQVNDRHYHVCLNGCGTRLDEAACSGGAATCQERAACTTCGSEYGVLGGHALTEHPYRAPSCTETGNEQYWECSTCRALFSDAQGSAATTMEAVTIPQTGHDWSTPVWNWSDDGKTASATFTCQNDSAHTQSLNADITSIVEIPATCTGAGMTSCTAKVTFNGTEYSDQKDVEAGPLGHSMQKTDRIDAACTTPGRAAYFTCETCGRHFEDEAGKVEIADLDEYGRIPATGHTAGTEWKSDEAGHWNECVNCGNKMNEAPHTYKWVTDKEATATETGSRHEECTACGYAKTAIEIPTAGTAEEPSKPGEIPSGPSTDPNVPTGGNQTGDAASPQTGDNGRQTLWFGLLLAAGVSAAAVVYGRRKKEET